MLLHRQTRLYLLRRGISRGTLGTAHTQQHRFGDATNVKSYSAVSLALHALMRHRYWAPAWARPTRLDHYDVVIIGAGGHGLATAYYLAKNHGPLKIAVLEKGYLGGGNSGRNTQVCRSNYFHPESGAFYEHSLRLYETLGLKLNFNIMFSQRGILELSHSQDELDMNRRWANAMHMSGIDSVMLDRDKIARELPILNLDGRYPVYGGLMQRRAGISRHDAVVWAFARAAARLGVHILQGCEVTGFTKSGQSISAAQTPDGPVHGDRFALCVAGHSSELARLAGFRLPIESIALQAMVTEPVKPILNTVATSAVVHAYASQSDRGEIVIGGGADAFNSYAQRGVLTTTQENARATVELFPCLSRLRVMRQWAGICDISPDASPIVGKTPLDNLYVSTGWGTGGFKAIPAGGHTLAHSIATGHTHPLLKPFSLERFTTGRLIDEAAAAGVAH